jgi:hypothetical protein
MTAGLPGTGLYYTHHVSKEKVEDLLKKEVPDQTVKYTQSEKLERIRNELDLRRP